MVQKRIQFISFEEFKRIYSREKSPQMKLCMLLGFGSGLRISEIIGYKRKSKRRKNKETGIIEFIKDDSEIPSLKKEMIDFKAHQVRLEDGKFGKWRTTVTPPALTEKMLNLLPIKIPRRTIQYNFENLSKRVLGKRMSFHTLRHGFGNYHANVLRTPMPVIQQMLGHSRLDTTGIYTKANPEESIKMAWESMGGK